MKKLLAFALAATMLSGCMAPGSLSNPPGAPQINYVPTIDLQGVNPDQYQTDLAQCNTYAQDVAKKALQSAVAGALVGALLGAAIGGGRFAGYGAGIGAANGVVAGGANADGRNRVVVGNCMAGRGYRILAY